MRVGRGNQHAIGSQPRFGVRSLFDFVDHTPRHSRIVHDDDRDTLHPIVHHNASGMKIVDLYVAHHVRDARSDVH